jgi:hypothetical protein
MILATSSKDRCALAWQFMRSPAMAGNWLPFWVTFWANQKLTRRRHLKKLKPRSLLANI